MRVCTQIRPGRWKRRISASDESLHRLAALAVSGVASIVLLEDRLALGRSEAELFEDAVAVLARARWWLVRVPVRGTSGARADLRGNLLEEAAQPEIARIGFEEAVPLRRLGQ